MKTVGIICEYNPFHLGHAKQIAAIRREFGEDTAVVCAMSGNFVQRGHPAVFDKSIRAKAALACGADLVVELPLTTALSSAEGFARGGVEVLSKVCDTLCFGAETAYGTHFMDTAAALLDGAFPPLLHKYLDQGMSFPSARQRALEEMGLPGLTLPNDILGVEYCKAILASGSRMAIFPIRREGSYHAETADPENPSATALRKRILSGESWQEFVPEPSREIFEGVSRHTLAAGERAILMKLRTMTDEDFEALPFGSEGLWRKLMHESRRQPDLESILTTVKSKRYARTRLDRMVMCAFLGITEEMRTAPLPYARVLAFNGKGRSILGQAKKEGFFRNTGEALDNDYWALEKRAGDLYGLFCTAAPEPPGAEENRRVFYQR